MAIISHRVVISEVQSLVHIEGNEESGNITFFVPEGRNHLYLGEVNGRFQDCANVDCSFNSCHPGW